MVERGAVVVVMADVKAQSGRTLKSGQQVRVLGLRPDGSALVTTRLASRQTWTSTFVIEATNLR